MMQRMTQRYEVFGPTDIVLEKRICEKEVLYIDRQSTRCNDNTPKTPSKLIRFLSFPMTSCTTTCEVRSSRPVRLRSKQKHLVAHLRHRTGSIKAQLDQILLRGVDQAWRSTQQNLRIRIRRRNLLLEQLL